MPLIKHMGVIKIFKENTNYEKIESNKIDKLIGLVEELISKRAMFDKLQIEMKSNNLKDSIVEEGRNIASIQDVVLNLRMVSLNVIFERLPEIIEQINFNMQRKINLKADYQNIEVDKRIVDFLEEHFCFLIEMMCNEYMNIGKEEKSLYVKSYSESNKAIISIAYGDFEEKQLRVIEGSREEPFIALKDNLQAAGGNIEVFVKEDCIRKIEISIPINLSIIKALIVKQGEHCFGIPINKVETILNFSDVKVMNTNNKEVITFRNKTVPLIRLREMLNIDSSNDDLNIVIVKTVNGIEALSVSSLIGQKDIVIKPLGELFREVVEIKSSAILGDGKIALILNL